MFHFVNSFTGEAAFLEGRIARPRRHSLAMATFFMIIVLKRSHSSVAGSFHPSHRPEVADARAQRPCHSFCHATFWLESASPIRRSSTPSRQISSVNCPDMQDP